MDQSKRGFIPMMHGITLSKSLCPQTWDEWTHMSLIPYALAIRSIMYSMLCTRFNVSYALSLTSRYQMDHGGVVVIGDVMSILNTHFISMLY